MDITTYYTLKLTHHLSHLARMLIIIEKAHLKSLIGLLILLTSQARLYSLSHLIKRSVQAPAGHSNCFQQKE